jgi:alcohol dehydrogenase
LNNRRIIEVEFPHMTQAAAPDLTTDRLPGAFDWQARTRLIFGPGSLARVGELAVELGARRVLLVTDSGIVAAGHAGRAQAFLEKAGLFVAVDDIVRENPTTADVDRCVEIARDAGVDCLIGLGGGSSMDTAKGCNFILTNGGEMKDYWGVGKAVRPMMPLIAIPTTAGTGSECQSAALIADEDTHQKMACLDPKAAARVAILDPELTVSQPPRVTACTGVDALAHAVETAVTRKRNALSEVFSRESFRLCFHALPQVLAEPENLAARGRMQLGAAYAGLAIENSMLGAAHSAANPLTAHHGVVHGQAVGLLLPEIVRFNWSVAGDGYAGLCAAAGLPADPERLASALEKILHLAGLAARLTECGVTAEKIPALAAEAAQQWTANFNPRTIHADDFARIYETLL